ncbi:hypothetical protein MLD38_017698 [Melastoma candidum]|uniref:Uncharacterized protein n=1 Tax=Melastoma candidum TaxID=119954 RepID=A0ACB9QS06_9MYRT|nr:hypothetical protein MLD38_017698 [Melastoma candidum]
MKRLRLVMIRDVHISGCPEYLSIDLTWLDVHGNESPGPSEIRCQGVVVTIPGTNWEATVEYSGILESQSRTTWACQCPISVKMEIIKKDASCADGEKMWELFVITTPIAVSFSVHGSQDIFAMELLKATKNFSDHNRIGIGSFGSVHHGVLDDGLAIKRSARRPRERFKGHAFTSYGQHPQSHVHHKNSVRLLGLMERRQPTRVC